MAKIKYYVVSSEEFITSDGKRGYGLTGFTNKKEASLFSDACSTYGSRSSYVLTLGTDKRLKYLKGYKDGEEVYIDANEYAGTLDDYIL